MLNTVPLNVYHKIFGHGKVVKTLKDKIYVSFNGQQKMFIYPDAFEKGFLKEDDASNLEKDKRKKAVNSHKKQGFPYERSADVSNEAEAREIILDASDRMGYRYIYEAINAVVGTHYTAWMRACWPSTYPQYPFRMWFPKLKEIRDGIEVPAAYDCLNTLSEDWNEFVFDDLKTGISEDGEHYSGYDLIFAKDPYGGDYIFRGVYISDQEKSKFKHYVSKRIGTRVKLTGQPAHNIQIIDDFRYCEEE